MGTPIRRMPHFSSHGLVSPVTKKRSGRDANNARPHRQRASGQGCSRVGRRPSEDTRARYERSPAATLDGPESPHASPILAHQGADQHRWAASPPIGFGRNPMPIGVVFWLGTCGSALPGAAGAAGQASWVCGFEPSARPGEPWSVVCRKRTDAEANGETGSKIGHPLADGRTVVARGASLRHT
jgi:hypothetical protein